MNKHINKKKGAVIVMAYTNCAGTLAGNLAKDCDTPLAGGYTGRGVLIALADNPTIAQSATNPRTISSVTMPSGKKVAVIDNSFGPTPLTGSTVQSNTDDGMLKYRKTLVVQIPQRGSDVSKDVVEPLSQAPLGYMAILEKKDRQGNGSFEVVGFEQGLTATEDGITRNEYENGGCTIATLSCNETWYEVAFFDTDYNTTLAAFEALLAQGY